MAVLWTGYPCAAQICSTPIAASPTLHETCNQSAQLNSHRLQVGPYKLAGRFGPAELQSYFIAIALALPGGGFRMSIFHLALLKRLAELNWPPRVDVISNVSGGSVILVRSPTNLVLIIQIAIADFLFPKKRDEALLS